MERLILIDAFAHIYRGFYALPPLTNAEGIPTNAVFAFAKILVFIEKNFPSSFGSVVFDKGKPLKRLELAPDYKATRPPTPPELLKQIPYAKEIADAFGWVVSEIENNEADDLIAAICKELTQEKIFIVSNDKDLAQLVNENISMLVSSKDGGLHLLDKQGVLAKFAVCPEQIVDYLALTGDSSDNIIGAQGIGPKTAAKLLCEFKSIDGIIANLPSIKSEKIRNSILESKERLKRNRELIRLPLSNPFPKKNNIEDFKKRLPDLIRITKICEKLGLKSILKDFEQEKENNTSRQINETYTPDLFNSN